MPMNAALGKLLQEECQPGLHSETGEKRERGRGDWRKQKERGEKLGRSPGGSVKW